MPWPHLRVMGGGGELSQCPVVGQQFGRGAQLVLATIGAKPPEPKPLRRHQVEVFADGPALGVGAETPQQQRRLAVIELQGELGQGFVRRPLVAGEQHRGGRRPRERRRGERVHHRERCRRRWHPASPRPARAPPPPGAPVAGDGGSPPAPCFCPASATQGEAGGASDHHERGAPEGPLRACTGRSLAPRSPFEPPLQTAAAGVDHSTL